MYKNITKIAMKGIGLAMGAAAAVIGILGEGDPDALITLLGIGGDCSRRVESRLIASVLHSQAQPRDWATEDIYEYVMIFALNDPFPTLVKDNRTKRKSPKRFFWRTR